MKLVVVGLSHRTAAVAVRERAAIPEVALEDVLATLRTVAGVEEGLIVSTCNRTEVYALAAEPETAAQRLRQFVADAAKIPLGELDPHLYVHLRDDAARHIFRVASSLDSMVVGESQILGQVKAAFAAAQSAEAARAGLGRVMDKAFAIAKRVRGETAVAESPASVSSVAVELAKTIFGDLTGRSVLLIGAGKMGQLTLRHLHAAGVRNVFVANRSRDRATGALQMFDDVNGSYVPLDRILEPLEKVDIAVSAVQVDNYLFGREEAHHLQKRRRARPLFLVDISVPRSLDPAVHEEENIFLYDVDDMRGIVEQNLEGRRAEAGRAESIIRSETGAFLDGLRERDAVPAIRDLLARFEGIRTSELERHGARLDGLTDEQRQAVDAISKAMMKKVAHGAIIELKRASTAADGGTAIDALKRALLSDHPNDGDKKR